MELLTVGTQPAELNVVEVFPRGAGVVHLAEGVNVSIAPALDLISATGEIVIKNSGRRLLGNYVLQS